jgi:hypothetical protein
MNKPLLRSFELLNYSIEVFYLDEVLNDKGERVFGWCDPHQAKIYVSLKSPHDDKPLSYDALQHCIAHEVAHFKLYFIDEDFYQDEAKIDLLGALDAQYDKTKVIS